MVTASYPHPASRSYLNKFAQHLPSAPLIVLMFVLDWNMKSLNLKRKCKVGRISGQPHLAAGTAN